MLTAKDNKNISQLFKVMGDPFHLRLLLTLAEQEACVCHLVTTLSKRQAYISQHLMSLRESGIVTTRREGKYIFYSLKDREVLDLIRRAAKIAGLTKEELKANTKTSNLSSCPCPQCGDTQRIPIKQ